MSEALQFWSSLVLPMAVMLAAPKLRWLAVLAPLSAAAVVVAATFGSADVWTGLLVLIALTGLGCGLALRVMLDVVWRFKSGR